MKKFCLFISLFFATIIFSGCSVKYNLVIDNKKHVSENISLLEFNDNLLKYAPSIDDFLSKYSDNFKDYKVKKVNGKAQSGFDIKESYSNLYAYKNSKFFTYVFDDAVIEDTGKTFNFNTSGEYHRQNLFTVPLESVFKYSIDEVVVNIQFYNEVLTNNADKYDKASNTYTWIINKSDVSKQIQFSLSDKVRSDIMIKAFIDKNKLLLLAFGGIIFCVILFVKGFFRVMDRNNRI